MLAVEDDGAKVKFKTVIMSKPEGMKTVGLVVRKVEYGDGTDWKLEE